jgi:hypothetical protein
MKCRALHFGRCMMCVDLFFDTFADGLYIRVAAFARGKLYADVGDEPCLLIVPLTARLISNEDPDDKLFSEMDEPPQS